MAKMKKYPKQPKLNSSMDVWKRYEDRCKAVSKYNSDLKKAPSLKNAIKSRISSLRNK
jgi:hypothetical protein